MKQFTSLDLQQQTGEIQRAVMAEPVVITSHGKPRAVMLSVDEFLRLKGAAGEAVPREAMGRGRTVVQRGVPIDPLGYDTRDLRSCALAMAAAALSGRNRAAVQAEIAAAERRLGLTR
jgi:prevent-host-death family protein